MRGIWRQTFTLLAGLSGAWAATCGMAYAHTSYMWPSVFSTTNAEIVTVQSSFAEDFLFRPEIAVESQDFHLLRPNGQRDAFDRAEVFRQVTILESDLTEDGTYRFTTGERLGRISAYILENGEWRPLAPGQSAPAGAQTQLSQTATVADVYVSKGAPTRQAVDAAIGRLRIHPTTHPSEIYLDDGFSFQVLFDGAPLANQDIEVDRQDGDYEEPRFSQQIRTDSQGRVELNFDRPGVYLLMTRHRADAPAGSETPIRSYTTSLTFEVMR